MMITRNAVFAFLSGLAGAGVGNYVFRPTAVSAQQKPPFVVTPGAVRFDRPIQIVDRTGNQMIELRPQEIKVMQHEGGSSSAPWDTTSYGFDGLMITPGGSAVVGSIELKVKPPSTRMPERRYCGIEPGEVESDLDRVRVERSELKDQRGVAPHSRNFACRP